MNATTINTSVPTDARALAQESSERGELASAREILEKWLKESADAPASEQQIQSRTLLAEICEGLGRYQEAGDALALYDPHTLDFYPPHMHGLLLVAFGSQAYWQNDFSRSVTLLNRAREVLEPTGDAANLARAFHCLGRAYWALDEQPLAREHYEISIEWSRRAHKDRALAISYMNLGLVARHEGDFDEAGMCYRRALRLLHGTHDEMSHARLQNNMGMMLLYEGNFYEAANSFHRALQHLPVHQNNLMVGIVYNNLAVASIYTGAWAEAESNVQRALGIARFRNDELMQGSYTETLGILRAHQGRAYEANELLRNALERAKKFNSKKDETQVYIALAALWLTARNMHLSLTYARSARDLAIEINDKRLASEAVLLMIEGYRRSDKWMPAEDWLQIAITELERLPYPYLDAVLQRNLANFTSRQRDSSRGERLFYQAEAAFRSMNAVYQMAVTVFEHGESLVRRGEFAAAHARFQEAATQFHKLGAQLDATRADEEAQLAAERMMPWESSPAPSLNLIPPDVAPLITQIVGAASGRERLLREVMFATKSALAAEGTAIYATDDDGHLYAQASVDLNEEMRQRAVAAIKKHLAAKHLPGTEVNEETHQLRPEAVSLHDEHCRTLMTRRSGGAFVLYVRAPLSERRIEVLEAIVGCARLGLQMIDLRTNMRRARPFNAAVAPAASGLFQNVIATSFVMRDVLARMERLKDSDATVLVLGESGTGKEVIARALHEESNRRNKIFLPFNCTSAPRDLAESQLFGHRRGTFTGAVNDQRGIIRAAEGGTLFLDEIGDLALDVQPKLLRFLQGGEIMPLGEAPRKVNVRVIAATNRDLEQDVRQGLFREDLFYRLNTFVIKVPPLRERTEDIPLLASYYFEEMCRRNNRRLAGITPEAMNYLARYSWPGNVRQLRSEIERIVVYAEDNQSVGAESLSPDILRAASSSAPVRFKLDFAQPLDYKEVMQDIERQLLFEALARHGGNATRAAEVLGLRRQTFNYKLRKFNIAIPTFDENNDDQT